MPRLLFPAALLAAAAAVPAWSADPPAGPKITWKKTVLDAKFRSEGVAVADVNKDGKADVLTGDFWYEAPDWKRHEMQKAEKPDGVDPNGYSKVFACWADDFNADGYPDLLVVGFPGEPAYWLENPKGKTAAAGDKPLHWAKHVVWHSACNETPIYTDLLGTGKRVLVMGFQPPGKGNEGQMAYFTPAGDPNATWDMHPVSVPSTPAEMKDGKEVPGTRKEIPGTQRFSHGLGVGDVNGDKRADVMVPAGWWEQPEKADGKTAWAFHPAPLSDNCADMYAYDLDGDGKNDVVSSSAHGYGIWGYKQRSGSGFQKTDLFPKLVSQTHALICTDINGDGLRDFVTGKRWWAHGPKGDADPSAAAKIYWFEAKKAGDGVVTFTPHEIDDDSGIGTQFEVADINGDGLLDVVTSNKKGVRVIVQERK